MLFGSMESDWFWFSLKTTRSKWDFIFFFLPDVIFWESPLLPTALCHHPGIFKFPGVFNTNFFALTLQLCRLSVSHGVSSLHSPRNLFIGEQYKRGKATTNEGGRLFPLACVLIALFGLKYTQI